MVLYLCDLSRNVWIWKMVNFGNGSHIWLGEITLHVPLNWMQYSVNTGFSNNPSLNIPKVSHSSIIIYLNAFTICALAKRFLQKFIYKRKCYTKTNANILTHTHLIRLSPEENSMLVIRAIGKEFVLRATYPRAYDRIGCFCWIRWTVRALPKQTCSELAQHLSSIRFHMVFVCVHVCFH